jgi:hypothetical protein
MSGLSCSLLMNEFSELLFFSSLIPLTTGRHSRTQGPPPGYGIDRFLHVRASGVVMCMEVIKGWQMLGSGHSHVHLHVALC